MGLGIVFLLFALAIAFLAIEAFVVPGFGIAGILGITALFASWYFSFQYGIFWGVADIILSLVLLGILLWWLFSKNKLRKWSLEKAINSTVKNSLESPVQVGDQGICISRLSPMGKVRINNVYIEATSWDGFVNENTPVKIVKIENNTIFVSPLNN